MTLRLLVLPILITCVCSAYAEEIEQVPLSEIWALDMPGTKDIHGLDFGEQYPRQNVGWGPTEYQESRETAINEMFVALSEKLPSEVAPRAFIFPHQPSVPILKRVSENLRRAKKYEVIEFEPKEFRNDSDMTLVFFSYPSSYYVHVKEVTREIKQP